MMSALSESLSANWRKVESWVSGQLSAGKSLMKEEHLSGTLCSSQEKTRALGLTAAVQMNSGLVLQ